jgi:sulfate adenylyltransferase subunit 1 (EFTu-like GTPase family)
MMHRHRDKKVVSMRRVFRAPLKYIQEQNVSYIPLSALTGDNVVESLGGMPLGQTFSIWKS